jgi:uncharacterized protein (TIGR02001 family)
MGHWSDALSGVYLFKYGNKITFQDLFMRKAVLSALSAIMVLLWGGLVPGQAIAYEGFSTYVGIASNYIWRGVSKSDDRVQVFGTIDYMSDSGFYTAISASNVTIEDDNTYELDFDLGFSGDVGDAFSYDVGYIYYAYPDAQGVEEGDGGFPDSNVDLDADYGEVYAGIAYGAYSVTANIGTNNGDDAEWNDGAFYLSGDAEFDIAGELVVVLHAGSYSFDDASEDYFDYGVSVNRNNFTLGIVGTDNGEDDIKVFVSYTVDIDTGF